MVMMDGNGGNAPQEIKATVDPMAVAQLVRQMQKQDAAAAPTESRFEKKIKSLLASGTVDKDNLAEIAEITRAAVEDAKDEFTAKSGQANIQSTQGRYAEAVADALEKYIEGDEQLEETVELLQHKALKKLAANPDAVAKFNLGQLDKRQINATAKEVVEEFSKKVLKRDRTGKGPAINPQVPSSVASQAIENSPPAGSIEEITDPHRREAFLKLKSAGQRWGKMTPDAAAQWAFKHATRSYKKAGSAA